MNSALPTSPQPDLSPFEAFAVTLAKVAGEVILPLFRADHGLIDKGAQTGKAFDPVTHADRNAEAAIRRAIAAAYPEHGVIGEEYGEDRPDAEFVWVLDPIDGTRAFISGFPVWTTLIALRQAGKPTVGIIAQPFLDEIFLGGPSGARRLTPTSDERLRTRPTPDLSVAIGATTDPYLFKGARQAGFERVRAATRLVRYGADAYAYAMVAMGRLDYVVEAGLKAWDVESAVPILEQAGGSICHWNGAPLGQAGGDLLIVGDAARLDDLITRLGAPDPHE